MYKITTTNKTFEQLVEANKFVWKYITDSYTPEKPQKRKVEIELWRPNKVTTNQEFLDYCKANNSRPATFNEALQLVLENPDLQRKNYLVTYDVGQLCYLYLYENGGKRDLDVDRDYPAATGATVWCSWPSVSPWTLTLLALLTFGLWKSYRLME